MLASLGIFSDVDAAEDQSPADNLASKLLKFQSIWNTAQQVFETVTEKGKAVCDAMPENPCAGVGFALACVPNAGYYVCRALKIATDILATVVVKNVNKAFEVLAAQTAANTISESQAIYGYYYSRATYHNIKQYNEWNENALDAIRLNMKDQHKEMKKQLQERHKDIANHVGQDVSDFNQDFSKQYLS